MTPGTFAIAPADTDNDGQYDKLVVTVSVTSNEAGSDYHLEGLLIDAYGTPVAWSTSQAQSLVNNPNMTQYMYLEFDGKMLYDQLPLSPGTKALKLVAVKIYTGNLSQSTLKAQVQVPSNATTPAYSRSQFEPSSPAATVFQDDLEGGTGKWAASGAAGIWYSTTWHSRSNSWKAAIHHGELSTCIGT